MRLWHLGKQSLWLDEGFSVWVSSHSLREIGRILEVDAHPPLFYFLLHFWRQLGHSEAFLRLPFTLFGMINAILIYLLGKKYFNKKTGLFAGLFWAISFNALYMETQIRMYAMATCFGLLATWFLLEVYERPSFYNYIKYLAAGTLCIYTHYYTMLILFVHIAFLAVQKRWKETLGFSLIFLAVFAPWSARFFIQLENSTNAPILPKLPEWFSFSGLLGTYYFFRSFTENFIVSAAAGAMLLWISSLIFIIRRDASKMLIGTLFYSMLIPFCCSVFSRYHGYYLFRYAIIWAPYFYLLFFYGLTHLNKMVFLPALIALLFINVGLYALFQTRPGFERQNWRETAKFIKTNLASTDNVMVDHFLCLFPLHYYLPLQYHITYLGKFFFSVPKAAPQNVYWIPVDQKTSDKTLQLISNSSKRVWVVLCNTDISDPNDKIPHWLYRHERLLYFKTFPSLEPDNNIRVLVFGTATTKRSDGSKKSGAPSKQ